MATSTGTISFETFSETVFQFHITPWLATKGLIFAVAVGLLGSLLPGDARGAAARHRRAEIGMNSTQARRRSRSIPASGSARRATPWVIFAGVVGGRGRRRLFRVAEGGRRPAGLQRASRRVRQARRHRSASRHAGCPRRSRRKQPSASSDDAVLTVSGYIINRERIEVSPRMMGQVTWIGVKKGDLVKKDQVVVRLDDAEQRARLLEIEGQLLGAKVALERTKIAYRRA